MIVIAFGDVKSHEVGDVIEIVQALRSRGLPLGAGTGRAGAVQTSSRTSRRIAGAGRRCVRYGGRVRRKKSEVRRQMEELLWLTLSK